MLNSTEPKHSSETKKNNNLQAHTQNINGIVKTSSASTLISFVKLAELQTIFEKKTDRDLKIDCGQMNMGNSYLYVN